MEDYILEMKDITKTFPGVKALSDVNFKVKRGEIHCLVGENGAGKSTLMKVLSGVHSFGTYTGDIVYNGEVQKFKSIADSEEKGIAIIYQELALIPELSVYENIYFGHEIMKGKSIDWNETIVKSKEVLEKVRLHIDPSMKVKELGVGNQQLVEIAKALSKNVKLLILDEPTAVLTPQEADRLFEVLKNMKKDGCSIILITHKLHEVLAVSDRVSILRKGLYIDTVKTAEATVESLTEMMVGAKVELNIDRPEPVNPVKRLELKNVTCKDINEVVTLDHADLTVYGGEILGIAGISGGGQKELLEAIAGLQPVSEGSITFYPEENQAKEITNLDVADIRALGVRLAFVPEDRLGMGLVGSMDMTDNIMLRSYQRGKSSFLDRKTPGELAQKIKDQLEIVTPSISAPVGRMSGGNVQKVLVGREIAQKPKVLMVAYPTRGIDINSSYAIYNLLNEQKKKGVAVICVIEDLDVLLELCDRIAVLCGGQITGVLDGRTAKKDEVGVLMTKHEKGGVSHE